MQLTIRGNEYVEQLASRHRREFLSLQGSFTVPDMTTPGRDGTARHLKAVAQSSASRAKQAE